MEAYRISGRIAAARDLLANVLANQFLFYPITAIGDVLNVLGQNSRRYRRGQQVFDHHQMWPTVNIPHGERTGRNFEILAQDRLVVFRVCRPTLTVDRHQRLVIVVRPTENNGHLLRTSFG